MSSEHGHHPAPLSDVEARTRALESILLEKGLLTPDAVDKVIAAYERDIGPLNGARVVARAWVDADLIELALRQLVDNSPAFFDQVTYHRSRIHGNTPSGLFAIAS